MIRHQAIIDSGILEFIKNPDVIKKNVEALNKAEKRNKATLRILLKGKTLAQAEKQSDEMFSKAKTVIEEAKEKAQSIEASAKEQITNKQAELDKALEDVRVRSRDLDDRLSGVKKKESQVLAKLDQANKDSIKATAEKQKYEELRKTFEDKVEDLKNRLTGL